MAIYNKHIVAVNFFFLFSPVFISFSFSSRFSRERHLLTNSQSRTKSPSSILWKTNWSSQCHSRLERLLWDRCSFTHGVIKSLWTSPDSCGTWRNLVLICRTATGAGPGKLRPQNRPCTWKSSFSVKQFPWSGVCNNIIMFNCNESRYQNMRIPTNLCDFGYIFAQDTPFLGQSKQRGILSKRIKEIFEKNL